MHEKWFISDTHFFHTNILKFMHGEQRLRKEFQSLDEMHNTIVKNWNARVGKNDYVYHLGDVTFQYHKPFSELMFSLNGSKRLIVGNHDKLKQDGLTKCFDKIELWKGFKEHDFTCTHIPARLDCLRDGTFNVHGHTHANHQQDKKYINVCVEVRNYTPVHLDEILKEIIECRKNGS